MKIKVVEFDLILKRNNKKKKDARTETTLDASKYSFFKSAVPGSRALLSLSLPPTVLIYILPFLTSPIAPQTSNRNTSGKAKSPRTESKASAKSSGFFLSLPASTMVVAAGEDGTHESTLCQIGERITLDDLTMLNSFQSTRVMKTRIRRSEASDKQCTTDLVPCKHPSTSSVVCFSQKS